MSAITIKEGDTVLVMSKYERDNLLALLHLIYNQIGGPSCLGTGDWAGMLYWKLAPQGYKEGYQDEDCRPNVSPETQLRYLLAWAKDRLSNS